MFNWVIEIVCQLTSRMIQRNIVDWTLKTLLVNIYYFTFAFLFSKCYFPTNDNSLTLYQFYGQNKISSPAVFCYSDEKIGISWNNRIKSTLTLYPSVYIYRWKFGFKTDVPSTRRWWKQHKHQVLVECHSADQIKVAIVLHIKIFMEVNAIANWHR